MNWQELRDTTMNPEVRILLQVTLDDAAQADELFMTLMGEDVESRRSFIQRKGEMNWQELRDTTMNPEVRILLQVTLDDAAQADELFMTLMGEDVESRRSFIQRNARDVRFLDI